MWNVVSWNENGIYLGSSSNNTIIGNQISGNNQYGLFREGSYDDGQSNNNKVYHNNFIDNKQKPQVGGNWPYYGTGNLFDNGYPSGGNYWSDYTGIDGNGDGIGDTPYTIDVNNIDRYPLVNPWTPAPPAPDFSITASLTSLTVQQGNSDTSIITITSIGGFSQPVQLSVSGAPPGVTATLNSEQVTPPPDGSTISTLTVSVATTATLGSYTLNVTGTNGTLTHSTYISLEITSAPSIPNPPVLVSPGSSSPGEEVYTLTPTFRWNSVQSADQYGLYIRDIDSNELIFDSQVREITLTETSYTLPSGILRWGKNYRWNMNSRNEACWGGFCSPLYFYVAPEPPPDSTPPTLVEDFTASDGEDERSTLRWTNPSDSDLAEVVVLRRIEEYPESHLDGELVYRSISPSPNTEIEFFDTALVNGRIYSYAVLSRDSAGNWNDTVREGNNAATVTPSSYANQPPEPQFVYSPTDPKLTKTWKSILFDASSSSDDDEITLFEWDWDGNGIYDWSSGESKVTFVYDQSGTYQVNLRVTDSDGARDTTSKQITISEWGFWDRKFNKDYDPPDPETEITNDNYQYIKDQLYIFTLSNDLNEYWEFRDYYDSEDGLIGCILHGYCDSDLKQALSMEMDPQHSPGLTYCIHILDALREMDKVEQVWTQGYKLKASAYFSDLLDANSKWTSEFDTESLLERTKDILIGIIEDLQPNSGVLGAGVGFLGFVNDCVHAGIPVYKLARLLYYNTLWRYFDLRHSGESHASAWQEVTQVPTEDYHLPREITDNPSKLAVTESLFKRLYESYGGHFDGWYEFRREVKKDLRLLLSEVLKRVSLVGHVVVVPHSPVEIRAYDSQGNITGLVNGELVEHIPNSACDNETGMVGVLSAGEGIYYEVAGTGLGNYSLEIALVGTGICTIFVAYDIPTSLEERHKYVIDWAALALGEEGVTVQVDSDGDGAYEHTSFSDATLTGDEFAIAMGGPVVESCNSTGTVKESFDLGDSVYVKGEGYSPSATYDLYVVNATTWSDGMPIPQRVEGTATTIASDTSGNISVTPAWNAPITLGNYDIVVDVNRDGYYNSSIDALDQSNVQIKAGFQTVPEFSQITILAALMIITMSATILVRKKHYRSHHVQHSSKRGMS
jgi:parallel beta-helix repeat protein